MASILKSMSKTEQDLYKKKKRQEILDYNKDFMDDLNLTYKEFNMKTPFVYNDQYVISVFGNEFLKQNGYYLELITPDLNPYDPKRTIYRLAYNASYYEEYEKDPASDETNPRYLVPLTELKIINRQSAAILKDNIISQIEKYNSKQSSPYLPFENEPKPVEDAPYSEMTIRDYIAIHTGRPVSLKKWINDLVKN